MKEFDFDELDKAVNSLMGSVKKSDDPATPPAADTSSVAPVTSAPTVVKNDTPVVEEPVAADPETVAPEPAAPADLSVASESSSSPLAARRGGRFMDVVHPSSDMKTTPVVSPPSREGITVQPTSAASSSTSAPQVMDMITPAAKRPIPQSPLPVTPPTPVEPETPTTNFPANEPWSSPFLPDAQVEKRPLGGNQPLSETGLSDAIAEELSKQLPPEEASSTSTTDLKIETLETEPKDTSEGQDDESGGATPSPDKDPQLAPEPVEPPLPAELDSDLVAIESGQKSSVSEEVHTPAAPIESGASTTSSFGGAALSTSSISPQYNEQPSTGDSSHQPIYDNEAIHQPLAHPAKKKKGTLIVIMIVVVVLIGSGVGAAAYYLGII